LLQAKLNDLDKGLLFAKQDAEGTLFSSALNLVQSTLAELAEMENLGAQHAKYLEERKLDSRSSAVQSRARFVIAKGSRKSATWLLSRRRG
jgi:GTP cyclohydrolase FolE2